MHITGNDLGLRKRLGEALVGPLLGAYPLGKRVLRPGAFSVRNT